MARIKSGTQSSRRSALSKSRKPKTTFWVEARQASYEPGQVLVVASDVGRDSTTLGLRVPGDDWGYEVYEAQGKNLSLGQVFEAWLKGDYALKRHALAMNSAMSREQRRELKAWAESLSTPLSPSQRELAEITLGR